MLNSEKLYATWQDEQAAVESALAELLPTLRHPLGSVALGTKLCPMVGLPEPRIRKVLLWIAKGGHPNATQDGGHVRVYGRDAVLWRWHPAPQKDMGVIEKQLNDSGVIDTSEW